MKMNKLISICKRSKKINLFKRDDLQFIGDSCSCYALYKMPLLTEEVIYSIFDIEENSKCKYLFHEFETPPLNVGDYNEHEKFVEIESIAIQQGGNIYLPIKTPDGLIFIQAQYLNPLADIAEYELYYRKIGTKAYIVVKVGMLVVGAIMPYKFATRELVKQLDELSFECQRTLSQKEAAADD